jgi:pimeloyl-ACP methyl ester carboxylesterase
MLIVLSVFLICCLLIAVILQIMSPGKPKPFLDANGKVLPGSISEKVFVNINGTEQGMFIRGKNVNNPILLYLHGGMPDYFLTEKYPTRLEDNFTVVWWEQRGSGISNDPKASSGKNTLDQMIADTISVTNYLRERFGRDKIYLMGHSGGSFIGIHAAAKDPELYYAYIGQAQMSNQLKSEVQAYDYMLGEYKKNGDNGMVKKLEAVPVSMEGGIPDSYERLRDNAMHSLGIGTTHDMRSVVSGILLPSWTSRDYTLKEKWNMWKGKSKSGISTLWGEMLSTDLAVSVPNLEIPVYFLEGIYDYTCSYSLAKAYFQELRAPIKGFYTFENSAHSPIFEEPDKAQQILVEDVLAGKNDLADKK